MYIVICYIKLQFDCVVLAILASPVEILACMILFGFASIDRCFLSKCSAMGNVHIFFAHEIRVRSFSSVFPELSLRGGNSRPMTKIDCLQGISQMYVA